MNPFIDGFWSVVKTPTGFAIECEGCVFMRMINKQMADHIVMLHNNWLVEGKIREADDET